ncbi:hypothetical protein AHMF7605_19985 [Adhaeribacter arboris]|uniref:Uncharacterized protein n=1 Tax=Adhaeribacter arboris TaxID=2072846 RepID=A0A2T2YJE5_9BACT|nr:hypothetical protein AHMF7605_19985 [Adhaeribacter arboris]
MSLFKTKGNGADAARKVTRLPRGRRASFGSFARAILPFLLRRNASFLGTESLAGAQEPNLNSFFLVKSFNKKSYQIRNASFLISIWDNFNFFLTLLIKSHSKESA